MRALALAALLAGAASLAQAPSGTVEPRGVDTRAVPGKVKLGEPFTYEVTITHDPAQRWELEPLGEAGAFEIIESARQRKDQPSVAVTTFKVKMQLFELGPKTVPDLSFSVADGQDVKRYVAKGGVVEGVAVLPDDAEEQGEPLYDIKPNVDVPVRSFRLLYALLGLLAALALGYWLYRYLKRPRPAPLVAPPPPKPLNVRTLEALDALKAEELPGKGRAREFYFRLSEIVRTYLGERYEFEALECTGSELLARARGLNADQLSLESLARFVQDSDLAKFAKAEPAPELCAASLQYAYRLVQDTWLPPAPAAPAHAPRHPVP